MMEISTNGNDSTTFDGLIKKTKRKAAELGGDFILAEDSGVDSRVVYLPGHSSYKADSYASYGSYSGFGAGKAEGYSVGPSLLTVNHPWGVFSVWVYCPSQLGVYFDSSWNVNGFHLNSKAPSKGLKIGDKLIGIDNYDISDERLLQHMMKVYPEDEIKPTIKRKSKRIEIKIKAIKN